MNNRVRAEVKHVLVRGEEQPDDNTLERFRPKDPALFGFQAQILIGSTDDDSSDSFDIVVCSPAWMAQAVAEGDWVIFRDTQLRGMPDSNAIGPIWFMPSWDRIDFQVGLQVICDAASPGPDWGTVAARIGRSIPWEFAYRYDDHVNEHYGEIFPPII